MNILIVGHVEYGSDNAAALRVLEVAQALKTLGHKVYVFEGMPATRQDGEPKIARHAALIPATPPQTRARRFLGKLGVGFGLLHTIAVRRPYDVVYCYGSELSWLLAGWLIANRDGARFVADVTEFYGFEGMTRSLSAFRTRIGSWIGLFAIIPLLTRRLAVPSSRFQRIMRLFHREVILLPPFFCALPEARSGGAHSGAPLTLAYAGSPENKEMLPLLFQALAAMPDGLVRPIRFRLVGVNEALVTKLLEESGAMRLRQRRDITIEALGRTDVHTARTVVATADFVVVIRKRSLRVDCGFPSKVAEAYRIGTPVISNLYSDMGNYVDSGHNGFILNGTSYKDVIDVFMHCLNLGPKKLKSIVENAIKVGEFNFSEVSARNKIHLLVS